MMIHSNRRIADADNNDGSLAAPAAPPRAAEAQSAAAELQARQRASALANPELAAIMADSARRARVSVETPLPRGFAALTADAANDAPLLARMRDANCGANDARLAPAPHTAC
jgi:hypothetical protein